MKDGFMLYCSHYTTIEKLSNEDKGKLLDAIYQYNITGVVPEFETLIVEIVFSFLKQQFVRDQEKYENVVERNKKNNTKRWDRDDPKNTTGKTGINDDPKNATGKTGIKNDPKNATGKTGIKDDTKNTDKDNDKDKDNGYEKDMEIIKKDNLVMPNLHFTIPSVSEIAKYCKERDNSVIPNKFFDFYEAKGWKIGMNTMIDWKAAVRTWEKNDKLVVPINENDKLCWYINEARQQEDKKVKAPYSSFIKAQDAYPGKVKFIEYA